MFLFKIYSSAYEEWITRHIQYTGMVNITQAEAPIKICHEKQDRNKVWKFASQADTFKAFLLWPEYSPLIGNAGISSAAQYVSHQITYSSERND